MSHLVDKGFVLTKQGAEAKLYYGIYLGKPTVIKERFSKKYRHPMLDKLLTNERTKAESRAMSKALFAGIRTPAIYMVDLNNSRIYMERLTDSMTVKEYIVMLEAGQNIRQDAVTLTMPLIDLARKIGRAVFKLHQAGIIHGDLTTSNMLLARPDGSSLPFDPARGEIVFIDFGLSRMDPSIEDKGVDLYVLERALLGAHGVFPDLMHFFLTGYEESDVILSKDIFSKLNQARSRGRKRVMVG